jgi:hypothetical protein
MLPHVCIVGAPGLLFKPGVTGYHYGIAYVGLKPISLDAASMTLYDSPLLNGSVRFFLV